MEVGDLLILDGMAFAIRGIYLAEVGGQSLIGISRISKCVSEEHKVPAELLNGIPVYRKVGD